MKRLFDLLLALFVLLAGAPFWLLLVVLHYFLMGAPLFFRQARPGRYGKTFHLVKLRSMREAYDDEGNALPDAQRLTRWGRFLRSTSLDELPELWNIIKGEMSWVGPRPLLIRYLPRYNERQARRHEVRPGLTGWAQVNGRNAVTWPVKLEMDVWYVENRSVLLDFKILWMTVLVVVCRRGISQEGEATMKEFMGEE